MREYLIAIVGFAVGVLLILLSAHKATTIRGAFGRGPAHEVTFVGRITIFLIGLVAMYASVQTILQR